MIIWSGLGILVVFIAIACEVGMYMFAASMFHDPDYVQMHGWVLGVGLILAGVICWFWGRHLARKGQKVMIDQATGRTVVMGERHALFFISMHWWAPILIVMGIGFCSMERTREEVQQSHARFEEAREARRLERLNRTQK